MKNTLLSMGKRKSFKASLVWLSITALVPLAELQAREGDDSQHFRNAAWKSAAEFPRTELSPKDNPSPATRRAAAATTGVDQPARVASTLSATDQTKAAQGEATRAGKLSETRWKQAVKQQNASGKRTEKAARKNEHHRKIEKLSRYIEQTYNVHPGKADTIVTEAVHKGQEIGLEPELILAIIAVESTFRARAVSHAGARGLMQVMPRYHPNKIRAVGGTKALFVPEKNIHVGTLILTEYLALSRGNLRRALLRYNGSLGTRSRYADKVLRKYQKFKRVA